MGQEEEHGTFLIGGHHAFASFRNNPAFSRFETASKASSPYDWTSSRLKKSSFFNPPLTALANVELGWKHGLHGEWRTSYHESATIKILDNHQTCTLTDTLDAKKPKSAPVYK
jgi:hypothetical protein